VVNAAPSTQAAPNLDLGDGKTALACDRPATVEALQQCVRNRAAEGLALYPWGGRTALDYGGTPRKPGVAIDTTALNRVIDYPAADMTITVEAGMTLTDLQATLAQQGQRLPLDAPLPDLATLGGIYATNTSGPRRFGWGRPRDLIIGVSFVTSDGRLVKGGGRVVKNVAGYDFPKLLTGSMGTLGIITQMTLKVRPKPEASAMVIAPFGDTASLDAALEALNTSKARPVAVEVLNAPAARRLGLPSDGWTLAVGIEDNAASVEWQIRQLQEEMGADAIVQTGTEADRLWVQLADLPAVEWGKGLTFLANIRPSGVARFLQELGHDDWLVQSHAGNGIVVGHAADRLPDAALFAAIGRLRAEAVAQGGNLILGRCPALWKQRLRVWGEPRGDWPLMEQVKSALDPAGLMNPGRFVGTI
jgi:glycolate oxidase FAD binding subunit